MEIFLEKPVLDMQSLENKMYKITVLCPTYNHEKFISTTLEGFVSQKTNFKFKVIVADDASIDETPKIIKKYAEEYPDIIKPIFRKKNLGAAENFQQMIQNIDTEYVALCEGDDYWTNENKLQIQYDFLEHHKDFSGCFHLVNVYDEKLHQIISVNPSPIKKSNFYWSLPYEQTDLTLIDLLSKTMVPCCSVMYRWRFIHGKDLEYFRTDLNPRDVLLLLLHAELGKIGFINKIMGVYRRPLNSFWTKDKLFSVHLNSIMKFYEFIKNHFGDEAYNIIQEEKYMFLSCFFREELKKRNYNHLANFASQFPTDFMDAVQLYIKDEALITNSKIKRYFRTILIVLSVNLILMFILFGWNLL